MPDSPSPTTQRDVLSFVKRSVRNLEAYALTVEPYPIKLNQNESPYDLPAELKADIIERMAKRDWSRYPPFYAFDLAHHLAKVNEVPESSIVFGPGSNELTLTLMTAVLRPHDEVVFSVPTFPLYSSATQVMEGKIVPVPLHAEDFTPDIDHIIARCQRPKVKMVFICTPNNPTGGAWTEAQVRRVIDNTECLVVIDEAYYEFTNTNFARLVHDEPRVVILRTFSKAMAMAGLRLGYIVGQPDLMTEISKVRLPYAVNVFSQETALAQLARLDLVHARVREVIGERDRVRDAVAQMPGVRVYPSEANFLLMRFENAARINQVLLDHGILVRDVSRYPLLHNCLRVTIGRREENNALIAALRTGLTGGNGS